jgi:hypothetical protein
MTHSINGFEMFSKKTKKVAFSFSCIKPYIWEVKFLQSKFSYDDVFFIVDKIIRLVYPTIVPTIVKDFDKLINI